jgi:CRP-like cAMP-binding protein
MAVDDDMRALAGVGLFEELTAEQLRLLAFGAENLRLSAGHELYREGHRADCAYVVVSGEVELFREGKGEDRVVAVMGQGAILGELALIADTRRLTGARTSSDTVLIRINRSLFRRLLEEFPVVAAKLHARISSDLQNLIARIAALQTRFN